MRYYKIIKDGYIRGIGTGASGDEIAEEEYNALLEIIRTKPKADDGYNYKLKADLTWELYELPHVDVHDDVTDEEFMRMIEEVL
jgi:hypothetical protein